MPKSPIILFALIVYALSLAGCQSADTPVRIMPGIEATDQNASQATFNHPISRLDYDLWRAAKVDGWAMPYPIKPDADGHYRGKGQMPDGRPLLVDAWPIGDEKQNFIVDVKIGHLGDQPKQQFYLSNLQRILKGKPMPKRGLNFTKNDVVRDIPAAESKQ
ncbi:MAG: hypothetical protein ACF8OB_05110 [Phycisphaeraceae bacterium JB051]